MQNTELPKKQDASSLPPKGWLVAISISKSFITLVEKDFISLKERKLNYNPKKEFQEIQESFHNKKIISFIKKTFLFSFYCSIFYFLPFWIMSFPISVFFNFIKQIVFLGIILDKSVGLRYRYLIRRRIMSLYKILQKPGVTKTFWISLFCLCVTDNFHQNPLLSSSIRIGPVLKKRLPGIIGSSPKVSWETFKEITCRKIVTNEVSLEFKKTKEHDIALKGEEGFSNIEDNLLSSSHPESKRETQRGKEIDIPLTRELQEKKTPKFIKNINLSTSSFLIEMKKAWEKEQKQLHLGFVLNKKIPKNRLQTLPLFFPKDNNFVFPCMVSTEIPLDLRKGYDYENEKNTFLENKSLALHPFPYENAEQDENQPFPSDFDPENKNESREKENALRKTFFFREARDTQYGFDNLSNLPLSIPLQSKKERIQNTKNKAKDPVPEWKIYARKQFFFSKRKSSLKTASLNKKPSFWLFNAFAKEQCQQTYFDLDELPLKLQESWDKWEVEKKKTVFIPTPKDFENKGLRTSSLFSKDYSFFSSNKEVIPKSMENGVSFLRFLLTQKLNPFLIYGKEDRAVLDVINLLDLDLLNQEIHKRFLIDPVFLDLLEPGPSMPLDMFYGPVIKDYSPHTILEAKVVFFFEHIFKETWKKQTDFEEKELRHSEKLKYFFLEQDFLSEEEGWFQHIQNPSTGLLESKFLKDVFLYFRQLDPYCENPDLEQCLMDDARKNLEPTLKKVSESIKDPLTKKKWLDKEMRHLKILAEIFTIPPKPVEKGPSYPWEDWFLLIFDDVTQPLANFFDRPAPFFSQTNFNNWKVDNFHRQRATNYRYGKITPTKDTRYRPSLAIPIANDFLTTEMVDILLCHLTEELPYFFTSVKTPEVACVQERENAANEVLTYWELLYRRLWVGTFGQKYYTREEVKDRLYSTDNKATLLPFDNTEISKKLVKNLSTTIRRQNNYLYDVFLRKIKKSLNVKYKTPLYESLDPFFYYPSFPPPFHRTPSHGRVVRVNYMSIVRVINKYFKNSQLNPIKGLQKRKADTKKLFLEGTSKKLFYSSDLFSNKDYASDIRLYSSDKGSVTGAMIREKEEYKEYADKIISLDDRTNVVTRYISNLSKDWPFLKGITDKIIPYLQRDYKKVSTKLVTRYISNLSKDWPFLKPFLKKITDKIIPSNQIDDEKVPTNVVRLYTFNLLKDWSFLKGIADLSMIEKDLKIDNKGVYAEVAELQRWQRHIPVKDFVFDYCRIDREFYDDFVVLSEEERTNIFNLVQNITPLSLDLNLFDIFDTKNKKMAKSKTESVLATSFNEISKDFKTKRRPKPSPFYLPRILSGYLYPDIDVRTLRLFRRKQKKEFVSLNITLPFPGSSYSVSEILTGFEKSPNERFTKKKKPELTHLEKAKKSEIKDRKKANKSRRKVLAPFTTFTPLAKFLSSSTRLSHLLEPTLFSDKIFLYQRSLLQEFCYLSDFVLRNHKLNRDFHVKDNARKYTFSGLHAEPLNLYNDFTSLFKILSQKFVDFINTHRFREYFYLEEGTEFWEYLLIYSYLLIPLQVFLSFNFTKNWQTETRLMLIRVEMFRKSRWGRRFNLSPDYIGYRLLETLETSMNDIAGIEAISPFVLELLASLSKTSLALNLKNVIPKGYLLAGPPGTGKTFLVRAIAGETKTPIFIESGSGFVNKPLYRLDSDTGSRQLTDLFRKARQKTPCIVFLDEIDLFGQRRQNVVQSDPNALDFLDSFLQYFPQFEEKGEAYFVNLDLPGNINLKKSKSGLTRRKVQTDRTFAGMANRLDFEHRLGHDRLTLLAQFLIELDGADPRTGVIVIGATNRLSVLDPALTRPGRLEKIVIVDLPDKANRIEIIKLYTLRKTAIQSSDAFFDSCIPSKESKTGFFKKSTSQDYVILSEKVESKPKSQPKKKVPYNEISSTDISNTNIDIWDYLGNITVGLNAADLAKALNESLMYALSQNTGQTMETIEYGIETTTTYSIEKGRIKKTIDPFFFTRFAYYQSGKALIHTLLPQHPDPILLTLAERPKNLRQKVSTDFVPTNIVSRAKLETRLIGFYAGKAGELCALSLNYQTKKQKTKTTSTIQKNKGTNRNLLLTKKIKQQEEKQTPSNQNHLWESSLGAKDLVVASHLALSLVEKWHFYSKKVSLRRANQTVLDLNEFEFKRDEPWLPDILRLSTGKLIDNLSGSNIPEKISIIHIIFQFFKRKRYQEQIEEEQQQEEEEEMSEIEKNKKALAERFTQYQILNIIPWWQEAIDDETARFRNKYKAWTRLYLHSPRWSKRNVEWIEPEKYYDSTDHFKRIWKDSYLLPTLKNLTYSKFLERSLIKYKEPLKRRTLKIQNLNSVKSRNRKNSPLNQGRGVGRDDRWNFDLTWDNIYKNDRDYIYHALVLTCFNKAFCLLDENRELFDYLADYLLRFEKLRQHEIFQIFSDFGCSYSPNENLTKTTDTTVTGSSVMEQELEKNKEEKQKIKFIFDKKWGKNSRRPFSRFFSYDKFSLEFFSEIQKK